jgi:hypothetical protein
MAGHDRITPEGKAFFAKIAELKGLEVRVGYQSGEEIDEETGADLANIALWNEVGTSNIPARPFLKQSVDKNASRINAMCKAQLVAISKGTATAQQALDAIGAMQVGLVRQEIRNGEFTANAPSTIKKKTKNGKVGDTPLIDTGHMRQSVKSVIKPKGEDE